jgi:hypothetical protein
MEVHFRTKKLQKQYESHKEAEKAYGATVARRYIVALTSLSRHTALKN